MAMLTAAALAGSAVFGYNRENFQFDKKQTLEREGLRWGMQLKRFQLFRDDVRDLVNLTVDRMDVYHLIGALFMKFCIIVFCKGRIQASAPPFVLHLFQLSNACAFLYLLLAVWLSMHASIASHSFGVKMLTRFVRLPIPTQNQILTLKANLVDFEQQGVANMLRLPFQDHKDWEQVHGKTAGQAPQAPFSAGEKSMAAPPSAPAQSSSGQMTAPTDQVLQEPLRVAADAGATSHAFLEAKETQPFEDLLSGSRGAMPERHVQLFRNLQFKWQCYDAYCRVCLGLGLNHILQAMTYYCICHALVENQTPSLGLALVVLFQAATIFVAFLDLAGLQHREIITVQIVSIVPSIVTALEVSFSQRDKLGNLLPQQDYKLSPLSFLCHAMWLELWLRIAWPSGAEEKLAQLPRRFRQVLFLDPFGDALNWDPNQEAHGDARSWFEALNEEDVTSQAAAMHAAHEAACNATTQLTMAQCALRRWQSVPSWCSSAAQRKDLARLEERRLHWGGAIRTELERCGPLLPNLEGLLSAFEPQLRRWPQLSEEEKSSDPFAQCLLGPFEHDAGHGQMACYYYDLENERTQFSENSLGLLVLSLPAVAQILKDVETQVELLMELRILRDLSVAKTNQHVRARLRSQPSRPRGRRLKDRSKRFGKNLVGLFNQKRPAKHGESWSPIPHSSSEEALSPGGGNDNDASVGETPPQSAFVVESGDRTLRAMAGKHARDFVPERLPWQILCRMTRVCQLTWAMCGVMVLLKELGLVQVDFQQGSARALAAEPLVLEEVRLDWPNGTLFLPAMLHCPASSVEPLLLASPTSLYLGSHLPQAEVPVQFEFLAAVRLPQGATWLSTGEGRGHTGLERLALLAPGKSGLRLWSAGALLAGSEPHHIPLDGGADWRIVAAGLMPCVSLGNLLPDGSASEADLCIAVAGWDGEMLPIAVIPLCESCGILQSLRRAEVRPSVAAPLVLPEAAEGPEAMALSGAQLLVALSSRLKVWDLSQTRQLGEWTWAAAVSGFKTVGICILPDASCDAEQGPSSRCGLESAWLLLGHGPLGPSLHRASKQL